jgi:hypothetical protein
VALSVEQDWATHAEVDEERAERPTCIAANEPRLREIAERVKGSSEYAVSWGCMLLWGHWGMEIESGYFAIRFLVDLSLPQRRQLRLQSTKIESVQIFFPSFGPQNSRKLIFQLPACDLLTFVADVFGGVGRLCHKTWSISGRSTKGEKWGVQ